MTTSGAKVLRKIQLGRQSVFATAVAATDVWRGPARMPDDMQVKTQPEENIGYSIMTSRQYTPAYLAAMEFAEIDATFQQILHPLEAGIKTVTPTQDGTGSDYIFDYPIASSDANTIKYYTIEGGDNKTVEEMEGSVCKDFTLKGAKKDAWKITSNWEGRQASASSFTGALTPLTVSSMLFQKSKLYIDNVGGTIGTTQITNSWLSAELAVTTGWYLSHTGDGELLPSFAEFKGVEAELKMVLLHNATTAAERELWRSDTPRQIRILIEGNALTTPGTTYSYETFIIDLAGVYTEFGAPNEDDEGAATYPVTFKVGYDPTAAFALNFTDIVELSAVP